MFSGCLEQGREEKKPFNLQESIQHASDGAIISIPSGIYYENIEINKSITLVGEMKDDTIIDGSGGKEVISINTDNVHIYNITIRNSGGDTGNTGVRVHSDNTLLKNCIIYRTKTGVYVDHSKKNVITDCFFHTNGEGICIDDSDDTIVEDSEFQHNAFGIYVHESNKITIKSSYIHTNGIGVYTRNSEYVRIIDSAISDQNQDGGGCWFFNNKDVEIENCNIDHNGAGVKLQNTDGKIRNSNFYYNMFITVHVLDSEDILISNCDIKNSYRTAVKVEDSSCQIKQNNIANSMLNGFECDKNSDCDIRENWWGNRFGPSLLNFLKDEKISIGLNFRNIKVYPWSKTIHQDAGSSWNTEDMFSKNMIDSTRFKQITFHEQDTDLDGVPDWWEDKWGYNPNIKEDHANLDPDQDGLNNIEECFVDNYGSNPFYKDVFIEVDWLESNSNDISNKISDEDISQAEELFENHGIHLHIDSGDLGGGEEIPVFSTTSFADVRDLYWDYFLHNDLDNPRKGIFHYMIVMNENPETYEGFVFFGWDQLDGMSVCIQSMQDHFGKKERSELIVFGIIHELGHQMGLLIDDFGGIDNIGSSNPFSLQFLKYFNYMSVMNYQKYLKILSYSDGTHRKNDFDDWGNLDFYFFKHTEFDLSHSL